MTPQQAGLAIFGLLYFCQKYHKAIVSSMVITITQTAEFMISKAKLAPITK